MGLAGISMNSRVRDGSAFEKTAAYSRAARSGNVIAVSGTAALSEDGVALYPGDVYAQTLEALTPWPAGGGEAGGEAARR